MATGSVEASKDLRRAERRVNGQHLRVELELALLDELHRRDRGHRLNHRSDSKDSVMTHGRRLAEMPGTENALVNNGHVVAAIATTPGIFLALVASRNAVSTWVRDGAVDCLISSRANAPPAPSIKSAVVSQPAVFKKSRRLLVLPNASTIHHFST